MAISDWETLLKSDAKVLPVLSTNRATELANRGQLADVVQVGAKLRELAATAENGTSVEQKAGCSTTPREAETEAAKAE